MQYTNFDYQDMFNEERRENLNKIDNINRTKERWRRAKKDLEDAKYIEELIFHDYVRAVRSFSTTWDYRIPMIKHAQEEIGKKKKKERENLSYIEHMIKDDFFKDQDCAITVTQIISGGYEGYYWDFHFSIFGVEHILQIPSRNNITALNIESAHEGKFVFLKCKSSCCSSVLFDDWTEAGLAEKIKEYINTEFGNTIIQA